MSPKFTKVYTDGFRAYRFEHDGRTYEAFRFESKAGGWCVDRIDGDTRTRIVCAEDTRKAAVAQIVDSSAPETETPKHAPGTLVDPWTWLRRAGDPYTRKPRP